MDINEGLFIKTVATNELLITTENSEMSVIIMTRILNADLTLKIKYKALFYCRLFLKLLMVKYCLCGEIQTKYKLMLLSLAGVNTGTCPSPNIKKTTTIHSNKDYK